MKNITYKHKRNYGFTLIEVLVVLVITALTTSLLITGLDSTWKNFDKLLAKELTSNSAKLPAQWFEESIKGSVLYHPEKTHFEGDDKSFRLVTRRAPNAEHSAPISAEWRISQVDTVWQLSISYGEEQRAKVIYEFAVPARFEYMRETQWHDSFEDQVGTMPSAVRIMVNTQADPKIWAFAVAGRPVKADMPPELLLFGKYEF